MKISNIDHPQLTEAIEAFKMLQKTLDDISHMTNHPDCLVITIKRDLLCEDGPKEPQRWMRTEPVSIRIDSKQIKGLRNQILNAAWTIKKKEYDDLKKFIINL